MRTLPTGIPYVSAGHLARDPSYFSYNLARACSLALAWRMCKETAYYVSPHLFTMAIVGLCRARKSTYVEDLQSWTQLRIKKGEKLPIKPAYQDGHTAFGKAAKVGWGDWYRYRHEACRIPINEYTQKLWEAEPAWQPDVLGTTVLFEHEPGGKTTEIESSSVLKKTEVTE